MYDGAAEYSHDGMHTPPTCILFIRTKGDQGVM